MTYIRASRAIRTLLETTIEARHRQFVTYARHIVGRDAEDAVAEAYLRAVRNLHVFDPYRYPTDGMARWLQTIVYTTSIDFLRKRDVTPMPSGCNDLATRDVYPSDLPTPNWRVLSAAEACAIGMVAQGFAYRDIADRLGRTVSCTKSLIHRARIRLRACAA